MKNLKMKAKLMISFLMVAAFTMAAGIVGISGMGTLSRSEAIIYKHGVNASALTDLQRNIQAQRAAYRGAIIACMGGADCSGELELLARLDNEFQMELLTLLGEIADQEIRGDLQTAEAVYHEDYEPIRLRLVEAVTAGDESAAAQALSEIAEPVAEMQTHLERAAAKAAEAMEAAKRQDSLDAGILIGVVAAAVVAAVALAVFFAFYISKIIASPLERMAREVRKLQVGNFDVHPDIDQRDEIGVVDKALWQIVYTSLEQQERIVCMAEGDYTVTFHVRSPEDTMNKSLNNMVDTLNRVMKKVRRSSKQVAEGAEQVALTSQHVAHGSTEQSTTIEQLNANLTSIQAMAENNSNTAEKTLTEAREAGRLMEDGMACVDAMLKAMEEIDQKTGSISRIIGVIEDIAFQTNILALNAAVEAARSGQHGKGFAVVADEVRNLASKSATAARESEDLIRQSVESVRMGNDVVARVGESMQAVWKIAVSNEASIEQIDEFSRRQKESIAEVTRGICRLTSVVQTNTASAEEAAAASEELSAQAMVLENVLTLFRLKDGEEDKTIPQPRSETGVA